MGRKPPPNELLALKERRARLQDRIDQFSARAIAAWPINTNENLESPVQDFLHANDLLSDESEDDGDNDIDGWTRLEAEWAPEMATLLMPSTLGYETCQSKGLGDILLKEKKLRIGQANDALQGIRLALSRKAILFRGLREATSKTKRNRSWDQIKSTSGSARHQVRIYLRARKALLHLGATSEELAKYQPLTKEQLKITAARIDPALRGTRNASLAWFWTMDIQGDCRSAKEMDECNVSFLSSNSPAYIIKFSLQSSLVEGKSSKRSVAQRTNPYIM